MVSKNNRTTSQSRLSTADFLLPKRFAALVATRNPSFHIPSRHLLAFGNEEPLRNRFANLTEKLMYCPFFLIKANVHHRTLVKLKNDLLT